MESIAVLIGLQVDRTAGASRFATPSTSTRQSTLNATFTHEAYYLLPVDCRCGTDGIRPLNAPHAACT